MVALPIHLDEVIATNGPLLAATGSHRQFAHGGRELNVRIDHSLVFDTLGIMTRGVLAGFDFAYRQHAPSFALLLEALRFRA